MAALEHIQAPSGADLEAARERLREAAYAARESFAAFCAFALDFPVARHQWRFVEPCVAIESTPGTRYVISGPAQHGKTTITTRLFAQWAIGRGAAGYNDIRNVVLAAYNGDRAAAMSVAVRDAFADPHSPVRLAFPEAQPGDHWTEKSWCLRGQEAIEPTMKAVGIGDGLTGYPLQLAIVDDYVKGVEEATSAAQQRRVQRWVQGTLLPRCQGNARIAITATRWAEDDLPGWLLEEEPDRWQTFAMRAMETDEAGREYAIWPERYSLEFLHKQRALMGSLFSAMYQSDPVPQEGALIGGAIVDACSYDEAPPDLTSRAMAWDTAAETHEAACWSAGIAGGVDASGVVWVTDIAIERLAFADLLRRVWAGSSADPDELAIVEKASSGTQVLQTLQGPLDDYAAMIRQWPAALAQPTWLRDGGEPAREQRLAAARMTHGVTPKESKDDRARMVARYLETGAVRLPRRHPRFDDLKRDLVSYPRGQRKDTIDALCHLVRYLREGTANWGWV